MSNRFLETYNSKTHTNFFDLDKNNFGIFIDNSNNSNFLATNRINKLKSDINKYNTKNKLEKCKFLSKGKSKNSNLKPNLKIETNFFNNKHFLRNFEDLFEQTTNNKILEYFNGKKIDKMDDLLKRIKQFNYIDFIKKIKRKKSQNRKAYNHYKPKSLSAQPYNYKRCSYSSARCLSNKNEDNISDLYLSTESATTIRNIREKNKINFYKTLNNFDLNDCFTFNPIKKDLYYNNEKKGNRKINHFRNEIERIKLFGNKNKIRKNSFNSRLNRDNVENLIYRYKTQKNLKYK